jgi:hypothetical protein
MGCDLVPVIINLYDSNNGYQEFGLLRSCENASFVESPEKARPHVFCPDTLEFDLIWHPSTLALRRKAYNAR